MRWSGFMRKLYARTLHLFPAEYWARVSASMLDTYDDLLAQPGRDQTRLALHLYADLLIHLIKETLQMAARSKWISLAGPLALLAGALWMLASVGEFVLMAGLGSPDSFWDGWWVLFVLLSLLPLLAALFAIRLRFEHSAGALGRVGLVLSLLACAGMALHVLTSILLGWLAPQVEQAWFTTTLSVLGLCLVVGQASFGIDALRHNLLPRWNWLPLLVVIASFFRLAPGWLDLPNYHPLQLGLYCLHLALTGAGWVWLGLLLMGADRKTHVPARGAA